MMIAFILLANAPSVQTLLPATLVGRTINVMIDETGRGLHSENTSMITGPIVVVRFDETGTLVLVETPKRRFWTMSSSVNVHSDRIRPDSILTPCRSQAAGTQGTRGVCGEDKAK